MRLLIDGDACPNRNEIKGIAKKHQVEMLVFMDYAHSVEDEDYKIIQCEIGHDSVDMVLLKAARTGDLAITQDYGLAGMLLSKGARVLHVSGKPITSDNIDGLLMHRYLGAKARKATHHTKGPKKRTNEDKERLLTAIDNDLSHHKHMV